MRQLMLGAVLVVAACQSGAAVADLSELIEGKTVTMDSGAVLVYGADGRYTYQWKDDQSAGDYHFEGDQVCIDFDNGRSRCDRFIKDEEEYYLVNQRGERYRVVTIH